MREFPQRRMAHEKVCGPPESHSTRTLVDARHHGPGGRGEAAPGPERAVRPRTAAGGGLLSCWPTGSWQEASSPPAGPSVAAPHSKKRAQPVAAQPVAAQPVGDPPPRRTPPVCVPWRMCWRATRAQTIPSARRWAWTTRAHTCWPQYRFRMFSNSSWSFRDVAPLMNCTNFETDRLGGMDT